MLSGIYKITCLNNDKFYIGSSININRRLKVHQTLLNKNKHPNKYLQNSWNKYGERNFRFEIIETVNDIKQLLIREKWYLDNTNCCNRKIGFNISKDPCSPGAGRFIDLTGQKYGRLVPFEVINKSKSGNYKWKCRCECGKQKIVSSNNIISGNTKSCGCLQIEIGIINGKSRILHGHYKNGKESKTHAAWRSMCQRCNSPSDQNYKNYGGRGITVCERWLDKKTGFINFLNDIGEIPEGLTLGRIDNNKLIEGYSSENCKLSTMKEQCNNRRNDLIFTFNNKTQHLIDWAKEYNINYNTLFTRIHVLKWSIKKALTIPVRKQKNTKRNKLNVG